MRKKVFVFAAVNSERVSLSMKLPFSGPELLESPWAKPTGYGLGRHGWVSLHLAGDTLTLEHIQSLVDEGYRSVAPKTLRRQVAI